PPPARVPFLEARRPDGDPPGGLEARPLRPRPRHRRPLERPRDRHPRPPLQPGPGHRREGRPLGQASRQSRRAAGPLGLPELPDRRALLGPGACRPPVQPVIYIPRPRPTRPETPPGLSPSPLCGGGPGWGDRQGGGRPFIPTSLPTREV